MKEAVLPTKGSTGKTLGQLCNIWLQAGKICMNIRGHRRQRKRAKSLPSTQEILTLQNSPTLKCNLILGTRLNSTSKL